MTISSILFNTCLTQRRKMTVLICLKEKQNDRINLFKKSRTTVLICLKKTELRPYISLIGLSKSGRVNYEKKYLQIVFNWQNQLSA